MSRISEIALIAQVATFGSQRAFGQLVEMHQEAVRRFLRRLTGGDTMLADDLAQETFIRAWQGMGSFRAQATFQTWVMRIAYRVFLDESRSSRSTSSRDGGDFERFGDSIPTGTSQQAGDTPWSLRHDLDAALATLSEAERTCVVLQCVEGQSIKEIGQITGMNENTIKSHLLRGKKNLANYLRKNGYETHR